MTRTATTDSAPAKPRGPDHPAYFDAMFAKSDDPWSFKTRWYEERKRALTLASLPRERFSRGFEPGCANGELSAALAARCGSLLVSDGVERAVDLARERLKSYPHVEVRKAWLPQEWPDGCFDLIVLSEFLFYLQPAVVEKIAELSRASLAPSGVIVACHWRHPIDQCVLTGDEAHATLDRLIGLPNLCHIAEPDIRLDVWSAQPTVAQQEGLA